MDIVILAGIVAILWLVLCWLLGREYYRGYRPLWFALLVVASFLLSWWILQFTQVDLWNIKPFWTLVLWFILSSVIFYWAMRKTGSCADTCECFCCTKWCACTTWAATGWVVATGSTKDDLKLVEWIGPKIEQLLNAWGIHTFKNLQNAEVTRLKKILEDAGKRFQMHNPTTWPLQAEYLVKWDLKWLEVYQDFLQGWKE